VNAPLVVRPRRLTFMCWSMAVLLVGVFALIGYGARGASGGMEFGPVDQAAMTGLGVVLAGCVLLLTRARVVAGGDGVRVRNVVGERSLPWGVVRAVRFDDGASWASLELQDDDTVALLAVQANDGEGAVEAVRELRRLLAESQGRT
jgi:hypothetical protein